MANRRGRYPGTRLRWVRFGLGLALADPSRFAALLRISVGAIVRMPSGSPANTCLSTVCSYGDSIVAERTWSAACFGPALRATRADPIKAVRPERSAARGVGSAA